MSVFTVLPQDTLQHEINLFLDPVSRASWNTILSPNERVYKKFPEDYALKVSLRVSMTKFKSILGKSKNALDKIEPGLNIFVEDKIKRVFVSLIIELFAFVSSPDNIHLIKYKKGFKEYLVSFCDDWINHQDGQYYYWDEVLCPWDKKKINEAASMAKAVIQEVLFIRHISSFKQFDIGLI